MIKKGLPHYVARPFLLTSQQAPKPKTMINRERFQELVEKYLDNTCTKSEELELEEYYNTYGRQLFPPTMEQRTKRQLYQRIAARIKTSKEITARNGRRSMIYRIAATISILAILGISYMELFPKKEAQLITVTSNLGEKKQVVLPDSSLVTLNSGSSITYPEFFEGETRQVKMDGEAFFEVSHNPDQPFWVTTPILKTKVLGTSFNIRAYTDNPNIKISLATGSIQVSEENNVLATLKPNEQLLFDKGTGNHLVTKQSTIKDISWLDNIIVLDDHSLEETLRIVERWFNVKLHMSTEDITNKTISGKFINPTLEETIESLELLTGAQINSENQVEPQKP
ncbi:DUF4974 domain-containing protein [Flagellimonas olearia]|uniref:DUF4974 domain-containing protein n=2 Tax=Flagellimonas olearia TaxID=552546 RepID=A0A6I1E2H6_9FLAO|nr:DUF4974 domain-containing protein [Allomuricauda olearia]